MFFACFFRLLFSVLRPESGSRGLHCSNIISRIGHEGSTSSIDGLIFSISFSLSQLLSHAVSMSDWELEMQLQHENHIKMMNWVVVDWLSRLITIVAASFESSCSCSLAAVVVIAQLPTIHLNFCSVWTSTHSSSRSRERENFEARKYKNYFHIPSAAVVCIRFVCARCLKETWCRCGEKLVKFIIPLFNGKFIVVVIFQLTCIEINMYFFSSRRLIVFQKQKKNISLTLKPTGVWASCGSDGQSNEPINIRFTKQQHCINLRS